MNKIQIQVLNPSAVDEAEKIMVCAARLTQRGHKIQGLDDFMAIYNMAYTEATVKVMAVLPHPTIQKFSIINIVVVGASRRFLMQITRHQNEVKFMSSSLQYSDYSNDADFVIPYEIHIRGKEVVDNYLKACHESMKTYSEYVKYGFSNDSAGYITPQGLRNTIIISATPYQWKHMISQRVCRRNTSEMRYIMLRVWERLKNLSPNIFSRFGPFCMLGECKEDKMSCHNPLLIDDSPSEILIRDFPLIYDN